MTDRLAELEVRIIRAEEEVAQLRRSLVNNQREMRWNLWSRAVVGAATVAVLAMGVTIASASPGATSATVKAPFEVVDGSGNPLMVVDGNGIRLDHAGKPLVSLVRSPSGGQILLEDGAGNQTASLEYDARVAAPSCSWAKRVAMASLWEIRRALSGCDSTRAQRRGLRLAKRATAVVPSACTIPLGLPQPGWEATRAGATWRSTAAREIPPCSSSKWRMAMATLSLPTARGRLVRRRERFQGIAVSSAPGDRKAEPTISRVPNRSNLELLQRTDASVAQRWIKLMGIPAH
jgi:hypothetical protein